MKSNPSVYSVSMVNQYIKNMFVRDYTLSAIFVKGEVSNCKYHSSGHIYFTLKDKASQITCVMFAGQRGGLSFRMEEGQEVVIGGSINVYERDGKYQIYARQIELVGGGDLYEKYEKLKSKLEAEGLFDEQYKQRIPRYAKVVGVVTAQTGAAIQDIINITSRRNPYVQLLLYPAKVQGEGAKESIVQGIEALEDAGVDVIIVGRGGGSIEDLWAFNEEVVARAIYSCNVPIISAVGHESDTTIADYVADLRAPTPSAAAELAVYDVAYLLKVFQDYTSRMTRTMERKIENERKNLQGIRGRLQYMSPENQLMQKRQHLMDLEEKLTMVMNQRVEQSKHRLAVAGEKLNGLSPLRKLRGGFAYVEANGEMVGSIDKVAMNDRLHITVSDGEITSTVTEIVRKDDKKWQ